MKDTVTSWDNATVGSGNCRFLQIRDAAFGRRHTKTADSLHGPGQVHYDVADYVISETLLAGVRRSRGEERLWPSLSGFRNELHAVQRQYQAVLGDSAPISVLSQDRATESALLNAASEHRILHVITHGYFEDAATRSFESPSLSPEQTVTDRSAPDPFFRAASQLSGDWR